MTFWYGPGSGSADPCLWLKDPDADPDPAIFVIDLQGAKKKLIFLKKFSAYYFLKVHLHNFSKIISLKEVTKTVGIKGFFSYYYFLMIEGTGSIPLTSGSGSVRPKNMWIRWIRILNTDFGIFVHFKLLHIWIAQLNSVPICSKTMRQETQHP